MSKENDDVGKLNLIQNNNLDKEISQEKNKVSNKRRRKELIDFDNEEEKIINNEYKNKINTVQKEDLKEKNIIEIKKNIDMNDSCNNNFKTLDKCQNSHSPFRNNLVLQEKLKKIFLNREKMQFQYKKQEIPDYLKYHSDDSDNSENSELRKKENNNNKESNLIANISDNKYNENNDEKINMNKNSINNENKSEKKLEEINEELKKDLNFKYKEDSIQDEENDNNIKENLIKKEELLENNLFIEKNEIIPKKENIIEKNYLNKEKKEKSNDDLKNNKKDDNNDIQIKQEINEGINLNIYNNKDTENKNKRNKLTISVNKNDYKEQNNKKEKVNDLFDIIGKLKKNQSESVTNKKAKKKLNIIKFPKKEELNNNKNINNINKVKNNEININVETQEKIKINKNNKNKNLDIFLTNKESKKTNQIQTIDLPYNKNLNKEINISYSSKGIPHIKYTQKNNNIPVRKVSELNRYNNIPNENSIDIELNTTPSSHLDRSYDAINNNNNKKINKENRSINVYRPKKINKNKFGKNIQNKQNKENKLNNIIPNQNIIYNNFNNFFNSPGIYNNNPNDNNINNNNFKNYFHRKNQKSFDEYEMNSALNNPINNSFDGYINQHYNNENNIRENEYLYYGQNNVNNKISNIARYKSINIIPINQVNNNRNLVFNNFYRNGNNNKSYGNIFNGINNNNIFDNNNYINNDEYIGNLSTKNNSIQNPKFITYNIVNSNPIHSKYPAKTVLNPIRQYNINNINNQSRRGTASILNHCIYNNKFNNSIYLNNNKINNNNVQQIQQQNKTTKKASINIEDLLVLEEKMSEIIYSLNKNTVIYNECFEFWNYYYNCSLFGQLENLFKTQNDKVNVQISINHILFSIMICYDYSYEIETLKEDYSSLEEILNLSHKILMVIYEHILSKISSESKSNIWVSKLKDLINNFNNKSNNNDYFNNSFQMSIVEKIIYNTSAIIQNIRNLLRHYKTQNTSNLSEFFKTLSEKTYEEIDTFFRDYIFRVDNFSGSVLASVFLKENENFKTEPAPYIHTKNRKKYSLILDLDETLIHFKINNDDDSEGVLQIRPGAIKFLEKVGQYYELIVFTAATKDYGDLLIDAIEENKVYFEHRFYRQHTIIIGNDFVKDLNRIGRPLDKIIIVDNMPQNFRLQKENGINIKAFWGEDVNDNALEELGIILVNIAKDGGDVRNGLIKYKDDIIRKVTSNISKNNY